MSLSSFDDAIYTLARAAQVDVAHTKIQQERMLAGVRAFSEASWVGDLTRIGSALGVRVRSVDLSVRDLARGKADEVMPLVRLGARTSVTIVARSGARLRGTVGDDPTETVFDEAALAALLEISPEQPIDWATGDPCTSLGAEGSGGHHIPPSQRLWSLVKLERDDLRVVIVYAAGVGLLSLATPLGVQFLVNTVAFGALLQPLVVLTVLVLAGLVLEGALRALQSWVIERVQQRVFVRVALEVAFRLPRVRQSALDECHPPELVNRFFDVVTLQKGAATLLSDGVSIVLSAIVGMVILAFYHPFLLAFDVALVVGIAILVFAVGRRAIPTAISESKAKYAVAAWLEEAAAHRTSLALGDGPDFVAARAESLTRDWLEHRQAHWKIVFRQLTSALALRAFASAALLGLGGWLVLSRQLSLGQLVAAELIVTTVVAGFAKFGKAFESFYDLVAATDKIGHLVDLDLVRSRGGVVPPHTRGLEVVAREVEVAAGGTLLLESVDLHLGAGSRSVIYASGGAGKSTLVDILAGVREPTRGYLLVDDTPTADISMVALRSVVAIVRGPEIFEGSVFENLAMGRPHADRAAVRAALQAVGLGDFVARLPQGLDTHLPSHAAVVGETVGILLTIARALLGRARLLVLDGSLDRLDEADRRAVWRAVSARSWTLLVTTARRDVVDLGDTSYSVTSKRLTKTGQAPLRISRPSQTLAAPAEET